MLTNLRAGDKFSGPFSRHGRIRLGHNLAEPVSNSKPQTGHGLIALVKVGESTLEGYKRGDRPAEGCPYGRSSGQSDSMWQVVPVTQSDGNQDDTQPAVARCNRLGRRLLAFSGIAFAASVVALGELVRVQWKQPFLDPMDQGSDYYSAILPELVTATAFAIAAPTLATVLAAGTVVALSKEQTIRTLSFVLLLACLIGLVLGLSGLKTITAWTEWSRNSTALAPTN
jgi:hypothetical protein